MRTAIRLAIGIAAVAAGATFGAPAGYASGNAPWCAVVNLGWGDVYWDCQYRTIEECVPNVIAGNRGFCNLNPYGPPPGAAAVLHTRHYTYRVRTD